MLPPHELKNKGFSKAMRGYNPVEVDEYVDFLIEKYTELYRENDELEHKLKIAAARLDELKNDEEYIRSTLVDAKRAANKIKADAEERAEAIVRSAKASCNTILSVVCIDKNTFNAELFERYSSHIQIIEKLTEGMDEDSIPETSEMRRRAVSELKARISETYANKPDEEIIKTDENDNVLVDEPAETVSKSDSAADESPFVPTREEEFSLDISREPLVSENQKTSLKGSVMELNRQYKETSEEDVINTPDSDVTEEISYMDFVKSVTSRPEDESKEADLEILFDDGRKKKKNKKKK